MGIWFLVYLLYREGMAFASQSRPIDLTHNVHVLRSAAYLVPTYNKYLHSNMHGHWRPYSERIVLSGKG